MWGQAQMSRYRHTMARIIPTRVGTRLGLFTGRKAEEDHPHACGDKCEPCKDKAGDGGSSPRVWGQAVPVKQRADLPGIIPTRVGTRHLHFDVQVGNEDHPHACGDKVGLRMKVSLKRGSSPRVWGQVIGQHGQVTAAGIIPTRVGTRKQNVVERGQTKDHPHACGDKKQAQKNRACCPGSSPRVWGQDGLTYERLAEAGIIPTRVGTRFSIIRKKDGK